MNPNAKLDQQAKQYTDATPHVVLNQVNELATTTRRERDRMQRDLLNLKLRNGIIVSITTAVLTRLPEIYHWIALLLR